MFLLALQYLLWIAPHLVLRSCSLMVTPAGNHISMVNSTCIVEGDDDMFGEDDHMSHHYNTTVYFKVGAYLEC